VRRRKDTEEERVDIVLLQERIAELEETLERSRQLCRESQENAGRLEEVMEGLLGWAWEIDTEGRYTWASPSVERVLGYAPKEIVGRHLLDLLHPDDRGVRREAILRVFGSREPFYELLGRCICKGGRTVWFSTSGMPLFSESGELTGYRGVDIDVTERQKGEDAMRQRREGFRDLFEEANDGLIYLDAHGKILDVNERAAGLFGGSKSELVGTHFASLDIFTPGDLPKLLSNFTKILAGRSVLTRLRIRNRAGRELELECSTNLTRRGGRITGVMVVARDISERKQMEEILEQQREELRTILDAVPAFIYYKDTEGRFIGANRALIDASGIPEKEWRGKTIADLFSEMMEPGQWAAYERDDVEVIESGRPRRDIIESFTTPEGMGWARVDKIPVKDRSGRVVGLIGFALDITAQKRAEEALRRSEERFRALVENTSDWLWETDAKGVLSYSSPKSRAVLGYEPREMIGKTFVDFVAPEEFERCSAIFSEIRDAGRSFHGVVSWNLHKDGQRVALESSGIPIEDEDGVHTGFRGVTRDITERKCAEEALEKQTRALGERVKELNCLYRISELRSRSEGTMLEFFQEAVNLIPQGWQYPEIACARIAFEDEEFVTPNWRRSDWSQSAHILVDGEIVGAVEVGYLEERPEIDEGPFLSEERDLVEALGQLLGHSVMRRRAEDSLRQSEERFRRFAQLSPVGLFVTGVDGQPCYWNERLCDLAGMSNDEIADGGWIESIHPEDRDMVTARWFESIRNGSDYLVEHRVVDRDGRVTWTIAQAVPLRDGRSRVIGYVGTLTDITERKASERILEEHSQKLEEMVEERARELMDAQEMLVRKEKLAVLGQLAGAVGHELRNPLGVLSNAAFYLQSKLVDADEKTRRYLALIASEVRNSERIVSDLLDFSRAKPGKREEVTLAGLVGSVLDRYPPPEAVNVHVEIPPDLPLLLVDPRQMDQVLGNIVMNAYEAMSGGGVLSVVAVRDGDEVRLTLADTGYGISKKNMEKLFEPLFTTKERGIGLGLMVSKNLVEAHGGTIAVESEEGRGTAFTIALPVEGSLVSARRD
jgi:PAS domain S-box-containing protein